MYDNQESYGSRAGSARVGLLARDTIQITALDYGWTRPLDEGRRKATKRLPLSRADKQAPTLCKRFMNDIPEEDTTQLPPWYHFW